MYDDGLDAGMMVLMLQFRRRAHRIDIDPSAPARSMPNIATKR
jgi:hypothetical protein